MHARNILRAVKPVVLGTAVISTCLVTLTVVSGPASAHVGIELHGVTPVSGKSSSIFIRPGHGCDGDATNAISVTLPEGATGIKGQQKAGWTLRASGNTLTWSGGALPDDQWDEFGIRLTWPKLADGVAAQAFYLPTVQTCNAELTVKRSGTSATVIGRLPAYAGERASLQVDGIPLTVRDRVIAPDGTFTVQTTAAKVPATADVTAWVNGRMVGNSMVGTDAWLDVPQAGSTAPLAMPAPSVTVVRAS
ncbi:MAG: DUF1775 domain-containing protein [Actinomycetales bacterium]|nr:DUF1775 domain-containing protein [Actinomycetales bacterium]